MPVSKTCSTVQLLDHSYSRLLPVLSSYVENVTVYISGFVIRKLLPKLKCPDCRLLLVDVNNSSASSTSFLNLKNNGGLVIPSQAVVKIVHAAEQNLRMLIPVAKPVHAIAQLGRKLELAVLHDTTTMRPFGSNNHVEDTIDGIDNHVSTLTSLIVRFFLQIRIYHIAKSWNMNQKGQTIRQSMTKLILFKNR